MHKQETNTEYIKAGGLEVIAHVDVMKVTKKCVLVPYKKYMRLTQNTITTEEGPAFSSGIGGEDSRDGWNEKANVHENDYINQHHQALAGILDDDVILESMPATLRKTLELYS